MAMGVKQLHALKIPPVHDPDKHRIYLGVNLYLVYLLISKHHILYFLGLQGFRNQ
jgi:hypothetical protein